MRVAIDVDSLATVPFVQPPCNAIHVWCSTGMQTPRVANVQITLRLPEPDVAKARELATRKGIGYQTLLKMLVHEELRREARGCEGVDSRLLGCGIERRQASGSMPIRHSPRTQCVACSRSIAPYLKGTSRSPLPIRNSALAV
jgi:hypothetical protein